jgi:hypothetical protein
LRLRFFSIDASRKLTGVDLQFSDLSIGKKYGNACHTDSARNGPRNVG